MEKYLQFREDYPKFIYHDYHLEIVDDHLLVTYDFELENLSEFNPTLEIPLREKIDIHDSFLRYLVFHLGLIEMISYYKLTCSPYIHVECGFLNEEQCSWFKKLIYLGLGEFRYLNGLDISYDDFVTITSTKVKEDVQIPHYVGKGNLILVGGGKDSCVSLELLKNEENECFLLNPKEISVECIKIAGYDSYIGVKRTLDKRMLDLNKEGFLVGHTPYSALLAFVSYLVSYLYKKKYIVLSNESSANESTVIGSEINHQYSKTYEFEHDFNTYAKKYFQIDIHYFSLLRPISELQIAMLFSQYKKYHHTFKSCNKGSKCIPWVWCGACPKCLFVYIILSPFLSKEELIDIFGCDLLDKKELLDTFLELLGYKETKPFECVGTCSEVKVAISKTLEKRCDAYLLKYYKEHYEIVEDTILNSYNHEHHVPKHFEAILKEELKNVRANY